MGITGAAFCRIGMKLRRAKPACFGASFGRGSMGPGGWYFVKQMKKFFYGFWVLRNPLEPETEWNKYYMGVKKANELFSANKIKGFATDRGRIYLKYGTADYIENSVHDSNMLPYQIWNFNKIDDQTNRLFIFAETAVGTNDYELIHSNVRGELYNQNWKDVVIKTKF